MQISTLGTSSGAPTKQRNVSATAVGWRQGKPWCLVDCGEGTQHQLLHSKHNLNHLALIAITHVHGDHCYGLPGLVSTAAMGGRSKTLPILAPKAVQDWLMLTREMSQSRSHFELELIAIEDFTSNNRTISAAGFDIKIYPLSHRVPSHAFQFTESKVEPSLNAEKLLANGIPQGPVWGQIQQGQDTLFNGQSIQAADYLIHNQKPRIVIIAGDNDKPECLDEAAQQADAVFHEATYTEAIKQKVGSWPQHSSAEQVARWAESVKLRNLVLTHFSSRHATIDNDIPEISSEAHKHFHGNLFLANDFDVFELSREGQLQRSTVYKE